MQSRPPLLLHKNRRWLDRITRSVVGVGGATVIAAIALIFLYLLWVVAPVFSGATIGTPEILQLPPKPIRHLSVNEGGDLATRFGADGIVDFIALSDGTLNAGLDLGQHITLARPVQGSRSSFLAQSTSGAFSFVEISYPLAFEGNVRRVSGRAAHGFEGEWLDFEAGPLPDLAAHRDDTRLLVAALSGDRLLINRYRDPVPELPLEPPARETMTLPDAYDRLWFGPRGESLLLLAEGGSLALVALPRFGPARLAAQAQAVRRPGARITAATTLLGGYSLIVATEDPSGTPALTQWFPTRSPEGLELTPIRSFSIESSITGLLPEARRKGFAAISSDSLSLLHATTGRVLTSTPTRIEAGSVASYAPRGDAVLILGDGGTLRRFPLRNEHPEISWGALWAEVWYEGYDEPVHSWQSSAAETDFEPKFSLTPLLFGTLKAAFYAMLFAVPLAVLGAVYTGYFMAPAMRELVKPGIEVMAALPAVVLGFLAGLWLAPLVEANLAAVLTLLVLLPIAVLLTSLAASALEDALQERLDGWQALLVIPVLVAVVPLAFSLGPALEQAFFGGSVQRWILEELGLAYDQRNAFVVGIAMGIAVVPTIFAISEDAVHGVPRGLVNGSLALGATRWQTLLRVVILSASPGIFSAVMIGFGRAVGETMIVLMATGNTPIMDWNVFEGMRTFAANIAVEMPESEVGSSHYRLLFLTALVLFVITFFFNTVAELVRQQLRTRYGQF
jgi:phosphate transport system permease protein